MTETRRWSGCLLGRFAASLQRRWSAVMNRHVVHIQLCNQGAQTWAVLSSWSCLVCYNHTLLVALATLDTSLLKQLFFKFIISNKYALLKVRRFFFLGTFNMFISSASQPARRSLKHNSFDVITFCPEFISHNSQPYAVLSSDADIPHKSVEKWFSRNNPAVQCNK